MPPPATAGPPGIEVGTSSTPPWEGADIFRLYGEPYCRDHPVPPAPQQGIRDLAACRTAPRGGHAARGPTCGVERYAYHACRHRHCPKCQTFMQVQWGEARTAALLPGPYVPLVFPLPHALNPRRLPHKRPLLTLLFQAARQPRLQFGQRHLGGQSGGTMVRHTWDQTVGAPCHGHCVIAAGARASTGARWREADSRCRSPGQAPPAPGPSLRDPQPWAAPGALPCFALSSMPQRGWSTPSHPGQVLSRSETLSAALPIVWPSRTTGSSTCGTARCVLPPVTVGKAIVPRP
jgi:Transposase zinc-binding domain